MVGKGQWVILTYLVATELPELRLSPLGVKEDLEQRPRYLGNYSYSNRNGESLLIATMYAM